MLPLDKNDGPQTHHAHRLHVDTVDAPGEAVMQTGKRAIAGFGSSGYPARIYLQAPRLARTISYLHCHGSRVYVDDIAMVA